jgi:hypothetical protein
VFFRFHTSQQERERLPNLTRHDTTQHNTTQNSVVDVTAAVQALLPNPPTTLNIPKVGAAVLGGVDPAPGKVKELKASSAVCKCGRTSGRVDGWDYDVLMAIRSSGCCGCWASIEGLGSIEIRSCYAPDQTTPPPPPHTTQHHTTPVTPQNRTHSTHTSASPCLTPKTTP